MKKNIKTERLLLREFNLKDVDHIFQLDSNPLVHKYLGNNPIQTIQEAKEIVQFILLQYKERGIGRFAAIEKTSGKFIGWIGLKLNKGNEEELNGKQNFYDIGYRLLPEFWGKGYATEASLAILEYGFKKLKIKTIYGAAQKNNIASNKVLNTIGLQYVNEFLYDDIPCNWYELSKNAYLLKKQKEYRQAYYLKNKIKIKKYNLDRYRNNKAYQAYTKENAKRRYHQDSEYKQKTIQRAKARYKSNKK